MGAMSPRTPEVLPDSSRITLLESEVITLNLRISSLCSLVEEQSQWLRSQSLLLNSQRQVIERLSATGDATTVRLNDRLTIQSQLTEALADEGEGMRSRIQMLEDRLTVAEDMIVPSPAEDEEDMEDIAPAVAPPRRPLTAAETAEMLRP